MIFLSYCIIHSCQYHVVTTKCNYLYLHYLSNGDNGALIHYMYATKHLTVIFCFRKSNKYILLRAQIDIQFNSFVWIYQFMTGKW